MGDVLVIVGHGSDLDRAVGVEELDTLGADAVDDVGPGGVEFFYTHRPVEIGPVTDDDEYVAHPV